MIAEQHQRVDVSKYHTQYLSQVFVSIVVYSKCIVHCNL